MTSSPTLAAPTANADLRFHRGEQAMQTMTGTREAMAEIGTRVIRTAMPDQHRTFFAQLPFLVVGALDADDQPWATLLSGTPGFAQSPDPQTLRVDALPPPTDPLHGALHVDAPVGILGIEPATRRRNRVNGPVVASDGEGFTIRVAQSFGNCPQYIRKRAQTDDAHIAPPQAEAPTPTLDNEALRLIAAADTFFIATWFAGEGQDDGTAGADVSHRGGRPGFVRVDRKPGVDGPQTLTWPDFRGNGFYNTLGNLLANPRAGLLFVDFASGDFLHVAGDATLHWDDEASTGFVGAQRFVSLTVREVRRVRGALPAAWRDGEVSPSHDKTGDWQGVTALATATSGTDSGLLRSA